MLINGFKSKEQLYLVMHKGKYEYNLYFNIYSLAYASFVFRHYLNTKINRFDENMIEQKFGIVYPTRVSFSMPVSLLEFFERPH